MSYLVSLCCHPPIIMSTVTWSSSWSISADVDVHVQPRSKNAASLSSAPLHLTRPEEDTSLPCHLSLHWAPQPLCCVQLQLEVQCSARHIELYASGTRRASVDKKEQGEVYLGTYRGTQQISDPHRLFAMSPTLTSEDRGCNVLESLRTLRIKFVSLMGDKHVLNLQELRYVFVPIEPIAAVHSSTAGLTAKLAHAGLEESVGVAPNVLMLLKGFQETMEREMETKIARVIDAKISALTHRLALSEQALFHLHKKMDTKDARVRDSLYQMQQKFVQLDDQLRHMTVATDTETREKRWSELSGAIDDGVDDEAGIEQTIGS